MKPLFANVRTDDEKLDAISRHGSAAEGSGTLYKLLEGAAWDSLVKTPEKLDRIAEVISFREGLGSHPRRTWMKLDWNPSSSKN